MAAYSRTNERNRKAESKSPPLTAPVDTSCTSPLKDPATSDQCRACNELHHMYKSYPDKRVPIEDDTHWICCDSCVNWYHCECVDLEPYEISLIDMFHCAACQPKKGPSKAKVCVAPHRNKFDALDEVDKPPEIGTKPWMDEFVKDEATKFGPPSDDLVKVIEIGHDFDRQFDRNAEWKKVYLIKKKEGLGMKLPEPGEMYVDELVEILGADLMVETIDVYRQESVSMSFGRYRELLKNPERRRLYNILSLEFSGTKLADMVRPPSIVKELSWAERYWPDPKFGPPDTLPSGAEEASDPAHSDMRPDVELFCLIGMGGSFTDFHLDFGGSSVWYHVYKGKKVFYIVEPTTENLNIYQKHQLRTDREVFLGDIYGDKCWRVVIDEGNTLLIPSGWLHAVYTPVDSLVFGGNFLTNLNVELQCEVNSHENRFLIESRYLYPNFETINWYAARSFTEMLREFNDDHVLPPRHLIRGARALIEALGEWIARDKNSVDKTTQLNPSRKMIHGQSQMTIWNSISKEYKIMEKRMGAASAAYLTSSRMSRSIKKKEPMEEEKEEERDGPRFRIGIPVPAVHNSDSIRPLKQIPRKNEVERGGEREKEKERKTQITPKSLKLRFRDANALPSVVKEEEKRRTTGVDVMSLHSLYVQSQSIHQAKRDAGVKEKTERRMEKDDESVETRYKLKDDADALERAEGGDMKKRKSTENGASDAPPTKERKMSALASSKQKLADKMKNMK